MNCVIDFGSKSGRLWMGLSAVYAFTMFFLGNSGNRCPRVVKSCSRELIWKSRAPEEPDTNTGFQAIRKKGGWFLCFCVGGQLGLFWFLVVPPIFQ